MAGPFLHSGAWVTLVSANDTTQKEELGMLRFEGGKIYRYVKGTAANITASQTVTYAADSSTSVITTPALTTATAASGARAIAGIAETAITSGSFGWITVTGPSTGLVDTAARVGDALIPGTTAGTLITPGAVITGGATTGTANATRVAEASTTGVTTGSAVFIRCL